MISVLEWGVDVIRAIQVIKTPFLTSVIKVLTQLGSEYFYLLFMPVIFWCIDEAFGAMLGLVFLFSSFVNSWTKKLFAQPRPYNLDPAVGLAYETSYGLPSGHAQGTSTFWGLLAARIKRPWGWVLAIIMPLLVSFTRLYLGVHFPTDIFLGLFFGWGFAIIANIWGSRLIKIISSWNIRLKIIVAAAVSLLMNALNMQDTSISGVFFGTALGACFLFEKLHFDAASGSFVQKLLRFFLGIFVSALLYFGIKLVSPKSADAYYALFRFLRYGIVGLWISFGAPWLFLKLRLAETHKPSAN
ncbi:phosphatase PAP2 family protein [Spirochaetota bacterium]